MTNEIMFDEITENLDYYNYSEIVIAVTYRDTVNPEYYVTRYIYWNRKKMEKRISAREYIQDCLYEFGRKTLTEQPYSDSDSYAKDTAYKPARFDYYEVFGMRINKRFEQLELELEYTGLAKLL